jgi:hypothetical protein
MIGKKAAKQSSIERKTGKRKLLAWIGGALVILIASFLVWTHYFHHYTPLDALKDLRAGAQVGHSAHPAQRFLELRYGPQTEPANREKAFMDLFNAGHIEGLHLIVGGRTDPRTKALVAEVAKIIADYRQTMTPAEKADLSAYFRSDAGRAQIREATDSYQSKDARFRAVSTPVIQELLTTLTTLSSP